MVRWPWRRNVKRQPTPSVPSPAKQEAQAALTAARKDLAKTKATGHKVRSTVDWLEAQRDENHFAEAILALIVEGRGGT